MPEEKPRTKVKEWGEIIEGVTKNVPVYTDLVQPGAQEAGQASAAILGFINTMFLPLAVANLYRKDKLERLKTDLAERASRIPDACRRPSPPYVFGPALEAMRFAEDEPSLRELYINLILTSMDSETVRRAHPSFVEIIKQMTPDESRILASLGRERRPVLLDLISEDISTDEEYASGLRTRLDAPQYWSVYVQNLERLGLLKSFSPALAEPLSDYTSPDELEAYTKRRNRELGRDESTPMVLRRITVQLQEFGRLFCSACTQES